MTNKNLYSYGRICLMFLFLLTFISDKAQSNNYQQGVIYVRIAPHTQSQFFGLFGDDNKLGTYSITKIEQPFSRGDSTISRIYRLHFDASIPADNIINYLEQYPFIDYAEKIPVCRINFVPNDIVTAHQYNLIKVNAEQAWDISKGSSSVVIAIVDNAVRTTHHDLKANIWVNSNIDPSTGYDVADGYADDINGWDFADNDNNTSPPAGINSVSEWSHGTHVAGIASAVTDNGIGVASLGFSCKIMALKCAPDTESNPGILTNAYDGVYYAVTHKANIINMSFFADAPDSTSQSVMQYAYNSGIVCVAAGGNNSSSIPVYPATYPNVIGVGATDQNDVMASFSNYGINVNVMAPGYNIYGTFAYNDSAYSYFSGTSMASPLVAGLAGLIVSENPKLNPDQVKYYIQAGCDNIDLENPAYIGQMGSGRINAYKSLQLVQQDLNNYNNNSVINVFPNPSNNTCNIRFNQRIVNSSFEIVIHNLLGQKVYDENVASFNGFLYPLNLTSLAEGVYIANIILPDSSLNTIIVKAINK